MFDNKVARQSIEQMKDLGVQFAPGLTGQQVESIESALGAKLPPELELLLRQGVPLSLKGDNAFPDWRRDPVEVVAESRRQIEETLALDIETNQYWHGLFGEKPSKIEDAKQQALSVVRTWPPLVRVYAHRYMPTSPAQAGNPVLSVHEFVDTVYYGYNFADYLVNEFHISIPVNKPARPPEVPYWGRAFFEFESDSTDVGHATQRNTTA